MQTRARLVIGLFAVTVTLLVSLLSCASSYDNLGEGLYAAMRTSRGEVVVYLDLRAPITVMNFVGLAEGTIQSNRGLGTPFYDGLTFHRVEPGFVVQGGDPNGDGTGNPGYRFPTETHPELRHDGPGVVAMANSGPDTNGCQFYFTLAAAPFLDGGYNVFGRVVRGMDVVESIQIGDEIEKVRILRIGDAVADYAATTELFQELIQTTRDAVALAAAAKRAADLELIEKSWPDAVEISESGVLKTTVTKGMGATPEQADQISVHLTLSLIDGTQIDDTRLKDAPYSLRFKVDRLVDGFEVLLESMAEGERATGIVPPERAWGAAGVPPVIPPNSFVVLDVELISIE